MKEHMPVNIEKHTQDLQDRYMSLLTERRNEYLNQFYNEKIDKKGGFYEIMCIQMQEEIKEQREKKFENLDIGDL